MGTNLAGKEFFEAVVVGDTGNGGDVGCQGNGRKGDTLSFIPSDKLCGYVSRIRGTSAVTEEQHFVSVAKGRGDQFCDLYDAIGVFVRELLLDSRAFAKRAEDMFFHRKRF